VAVTNCLNFGNPEKPETMWQFSEAIDGMAEACAAFSTPVTGGNVSFYNETLGRGIYPTPTIGMLGILDDVSRALGLCFHNEGDAIVLLDGREERDVVTLSPREAGEESQRDPLSRLNPPALRMTDQLRSEFSSSEYAKRIHSIVAGAPPAIDLAAEKRLIDALVALAREGALHSAHDLSDGGLAVALAECCFATVGATFRSPSQDGGLKPVPTLGADVAFESAIPVEYALFGERGARAVVSSAPESLARVEAVARQYGVAARRIGRVTRGEFRIHVNSATTIEADVAALHEIWAYALERAML
jgi:phosphoribosylformylglycinamidine synthase